MLSKYTKMAASSNKPFVMVSEDDISELIEDSDAENTKKQIRYAVSRMNSFAACAGDTSLENMTDLELDNFLSRFYAGLRKDDGHLYSTKCMHALRYGIHKHFQSIKGIDITNSDQFVQSNKVFKAMLVKLKKEGKGVVKHKDPISKLDMTKILSCLDLNTPQGLQDKVFIDIMLYFANRGRENLRNMKITDFVIEKNERGQQYIIHRDSLTKTRRENNNEGYSGHMYEIPSSSKCPVASFLTLKAVLNPAQECMWQRPKSRAPSEGPWYTNAPLGVNTLGNKMKTISQRAGCSLSYTNHSLRATTVTVLDEAGFASRDIMAVTGHKSESSLKHYVRTSNSKKQDMSMIISSQMQENIPVAVPREETDGNILEDLLLTDSQEKFLLSESNLNIQSSSSSTTQNFHFHGPVVFNNK
jgi:site-specific recombinase XerD